MIVIVTILCWQEIGVYVLPGIVIFLLLGPLQGLIGRFFAKLRYSDQQCIIIYNIKKKQKTVIYLSRSIFVLGLSLIKGLNL